MGLAMIQEIVTQQEISCLVHFTRVENLESIMTHGIVPIATAREELQNVYSNDEYRWDGHSDASCLSISFPNSRMFYKCRQADVNADWVVLGVHPSILWLKDCAFCKQNVAKREISSQPLDLLKQPQSLLSMFQEVEGFVSRNEMRLKPFQTTDVQAEVLVFDVIEPQYIIGAVFNKSEVKSAYERFLVGKQSLLHGINSGYFNRR